jgi:thiol-disulfide isomerase/thioredoxin
MQILTGVNYSSVTGLLSFINLLSLPYIFFSVYYQWKIVKQWCILCLTVQAVIVLQLLIAVAGNLYNTSFIAMPFHTYIQLLFCFFAPPVLLYIIMPALKKAKESKEHYNTLQRFKNNGEVFDAILHKQKSIQHAADGLGITLGNPNAVWKIIKVCNPYCGPCAKVHPIVEELVNHNANTQLQIIFTATGEDSDNRTAPVLHLLAIASAGNESLTKQALDDWYNAPKKDYASFAKKHPIDNAILTAQKIKIEAMKTWCDAEEIMFTPTFFVNGFQLPESYSISDLKYLLTD